MAHVWHEACLIGCQAWATACGIMGLSWALRVGAGEGNRTLMTSLEGWGSAIELRPRAQRASGELPCLLGRHG